MCRAIYRGEELGARSEEGERERRGEERREGGKRKQPYARALSAGMVCSKAAPSTGVVCWTRVGAWNRQIETQGCSKRRDVTLSKRGQIDGVIL